MSLSSKRTALAVLVVGTAVATSLTGAAGAGAASPASTNSYVPYPSTADGGEPSIGFDTARGSAVYGARTANKRLTWNDATTPATVTVEDAKAPTSLASLDAITVTDQHTNRTFVSQLDTVCSLFSFSDDAGRTYTPLHGHLRVGPQGTVYLPLKGCGGTATAGNLTNTEFFGGHPSVSVRTDNGASYLVHRIDAGNNSDESDPSVATGRGNKVAGGRVYLGWEDGINPSETTYGTTSSARISVSTDHGTTFSAPVDVSTPLGIHNVQFPEVIAGDDDRAAFAWLGTTAVGDDQHNGFLGSDGKPAVWHLYVSTTYDGGASWTTVDTTPTDPVQRGCIDLQGTSNKTATDPNICSQRNLLDFNDITVDTQGRVLVAYADGCVDACVTDPTVVSTGKRGTVMRQSTGRGLYAAYDGTLGVIPKH